MSARDTLSMILTTDPRDVGCDAVFAAIDAYVDLLVEGGDPEVDFPGVTAHLRSCPPCDADFTGLLDAVRHLER